MKHQLLALCIATVASFSAHPYVKALERTIIDDETAKTSVPVINVPSGHNVVVTMDNNQYIQSIWIDDPSILGVATDRPLCADGTRASNCGSATAMRLTQLSGAINLPGASFRQGHGLATVLTVLTTDSTGRSRETYQFTVNITNSPSAISHIAISSSSPQTALRDAVPPVIAANALDFSAIKNGRDIALSTERANTDSPAWLRLEDFIQRVDNGSEMSEAARESEVSLRLLSELERIGSAQLSSI
ncbi:MAG: hypothetical protein AAF810_08775 [Cyanobacteria bacterium P01_D01_bin.36]